MKKPILIFGPRSSGKSHLLEAILQCAGPERTYHLRCHQLPIPWQGRNPKTVNEGLKSLLGAMADKELLVIEDVPTESALNDAYAMLMGMFTAQDRELQVVFIMQSEVDPTPKNNMYAIQCSYNKVTELYDCH